VIRSPESVLIVGSGAREHALGWKMRQDSPHVRLDFAPGNGGTSSIGRNLDIGPRDISRIVNHASDNGSFVVVGPERPLAEGLVDALGEAGVESFGPTQSAARLESSKSFATDFMSRHGIPHPTTEVFDDPHDAISFVTHYDSPEGLVIKADGLAEGKAVFLPDTVEGAVHAIRRIMIDKIFGDAGQKILVQERLRGREVSAIALVSNEVEMLPLTQDYKRAYEHNDGPNTGGMGAFAPSDRITQEELEEIYYGIMLPTQKGMIAEGTPFRGALYAGIMMTSEGPKVLEYNVRFGDPETQVQMRIVRSSLLNLLHSTARGRLKPDQIATSKDHAVGVVLASGGYPGNYEVGKKIRGLDRQLDDGVVVFHAGTTIQNGEVQTSGGRVLTITATGPSQETARKKAYSAIGYEGIAFDGSFYRPDIAEPEVRVRVPNA
jgi:phosphoribosylamine---glycine ligase